MATATIEPEAPIIPHVHSAMLAILTELSVAKNGQLPSNMGGKPYITAVDVSRETKTLFVEHGLIITPTEKVIKHEVIQFKDRLNIVVLVEGTYRISSTVDGSAIFVTGVGDGLATGTAVASNIASTNALKNALLRTFLITEQSVEDAAKNGTQEENNTQNRAVNTAQSGSTSAPITQDNVEEIQKGRAAIQELAAKTGTDFVALGNSKFKAGWPDRLGDLMMLYKAIEAGETA